MLDGYDTADWATTRWEFATFIGFCCVPWYVLPKSPLDSCINDVRLQGPGYSREVSKDRVSGSIPTDFKSADGSVKFPLSKSIHRQAKEERPVYIVEYGDKYIIGMDRYHPVKRPVEHLQVDMGLGENHSGSYNGNGDWAGIVIGSAAIGLSFAVIDKVTGGSSQPSSPTSTPTPKQTATVPRESKYNLFVSHAWDYSGEYQNLCRLLNGVDDFAWRNYSVPETDPKDVETDAELTQALVDQIRPASALVVSAGMYVSYRDWIQKEIRIADEMGKPIIAVQKHGNERWPKIVENIATQKVNWNGASVASAIAEEVDRS